MAEPLRHRQTKEADNRYVRPTATAPHLDSTLRCEQAYLRSDIVITILIRFGSKVSTILIYASELCGCSVGVVLRPFVRVCDGYAGPDTEVPLSERTG